MFSASFTEKYVRHIVVAVLLVLLCMYLFVIAYSHNQLSIGETESFFAPSTNIADAIKKATEETKTKVLTDLFIEVNEAKEKESMCNLITNKTYRADIFNVYFVLDSMRQQELLSKSGKAEYNVAQLQNATGIIGDLVTRFVYTESTLDDIYRIKYGEGCVRDKNIKTSFAEDYKAYMNMIQKGALTDMESNDSKVKMNVIKKALCPLYNGSHQESITRVMNILISINHFYSKRIEMPIPREYKANLDSAVYQLYIIRKHVADLLGSKDDKPIASIRKLYC